MIKIAFFSVVLNHHQANLADVLYEQTGHQFVFVELEEPIGNNIKGGCKNYSDRPYLLQSWKDSNSKQQAINVALTAEVALFGGGLDYMRLRLNKNLFSFEVGERWLKRGWINVFSPRLLKNMWYYHTRGWHNKPLYKLCSSAYSAGDQYRLHTLKDRCYKWGYFTKVDSNFEIEAIQQCTSTPEFTPLMWCARFLKLKHPELPVKLAHRLKQKGYLFNIDMFGSGKEFDHTKALIKELDVEDCVKLRGNLPNDEILKEMRKHSIFLFTSDRNEGWGAVLNEAMSNGCTVVASDEIGSVPFLIEDGKNGMVFKACGIDSLVEKVSYLLDNAIERRDMAVKAYQTMRDVWSPHVAARNLLVLIDDIKNGKNTSIINGPCSKALPI